MYEYMTTLTPKPPQLIGKYGSPRERLGDGSTGTESGRCSEQGDY